VGTIIGQARLIIGQITRNWETSYSTLFDILLFRGSKTLFIIRFYWPSQKF